MKHIPMQFLTIVAIVCVTGGAALARGRHHGGHGWHWRRTHASSVPEIDASAGLLALAAVLAVLVFVWERRRRQNKLS